ncbi:MAG: glycosyltransferase family 4 protein [Proteobacteria bacterium]|nr:glycosyltransferase family 4 protein [Pseudomonadota bacterium]
MEYRPYYLAREWVRLGHKVTITAASFSHIRTNQPVLSRGLTEEVIDGIHYVWLKTPEYHGNGVGRVLNIGVFVGQLYRFSSQIIEMSQPDAVVASSPHPFIIFPAYYLRKKARAKLVFEVRDLWPLSLVELVGISKRHPFIMAMQRTEDFAYRAADKVVSVLPGTEEHMKIHGLVDGKFAYIPNGIDITGWGKGINELPEMHKQALDVLRSERKFIVGYTGEHGIGNALNSLVEASNLLRQENVAFVLVGKGIKKAYLQSKVSRMELQSVTFLPDIPKSAIPSLLDMFDVCFIGWQNKPIYRFGVSPNKLMDYMMAAKPVIHSTGAVNDVVAESGCGLSCSPEDPGMIANAVIQLMSLSEEDRRDMGLRGREYVLQNHDYRTFAKKYLDIIG